MSLPEPSQLPRAELGLPEGFLFLFLFNYHSTAKRKNPLAVIEAFARAFPPGSGAAAAITCINPGADPEAHRDMLAAASSHPDVRVLSEYASAGRKNAMIAACDCYVSLHRAEGFGLTAAEAMYLGKPVIATGFSGNLDYMTPHNSHLVDWEPVPVGEGAWPYPEDGTWAEPDVDHAAALMRRVFEDPAAAARLGRRGAEDIRRTHAPAVAGATMEERLRDLAPAVGFTGRQGDRVSRRVAGLLAAGPVPAPRTRFGAIARLARRALLRLLRPYSEYQRMVNEELLEGLREAEREAEELRSRELALAHARAETLAADRRNVSGSAPAAHGVNGAGLPMGQGNDGPPSPVDVEARRRLQAEVDSVPFWWHSIDLGDGVITPGTKFGDLPGMRGEWDTLCLPDLRGRSVLDIGSWDGFYAFEAERRGAGRVVAVDQFVWAVDPARAREGGRFTGASDPEAAGAWRPDELPGKRGFDLAHRTLGSRVEPLVADVMDLDAEVLGTFDVVLFLGVLYHLRDPLGGLGRVRAVAGDLVVIESAAIVVPGQEDRAMCEFYSADQLNADPTNWWVPNLRAICELCDAAGFARTEVIQGPPSAPWGSEPLHYRAVVHART